MRQAVIRLLPLVLALGGAASVHARSGLEAVHALPPAGLRLQGKATPSCQGGLVNDDGTVENAIAFAFDDGSDQPKVDLVMAHDLPQTGARIEQICICWTKQSSLDSIDYELILYDASGPDGSPGSLIGRVPVTASGVPMFPSHTFFDYDVADLDLRPPGDQVYLGVSWTSTNDVGPEAKAEFLVCSDENGPGGHPMFATDAAELGWEDLNVLEEGVGLSPTKALFFRANVEGQAAAPCVEDDTTLCLNDGRFQVEIEWRSPTDQGVGMAERLTEDTGYFWFFARENVEMVIKVLDACNTNSHYWVFAGGLTDVEVDITVTDTETGDFRTYHNPIQTPFQPIQDVEAFATCP